jgi:UDP-glucose 4-epimerase
VQKAPAATIATLAAALKELFGVDNPVRVIGTRHGEKAYETLLTREEMLYAVDMDNYYRVPADHRDMNYNAYYTEGDAQLSELSDYNSDNTARLKIDGMAEMLLKLKFIQEELASWEAGERADS